MCNVVSHHYWKIKILFGKHTILVLMLLSPFSAALIVFSSFSIHFFNSFMFGWSVWLCIIIFCGKIDITLFGSFFLSPHASIVIFLLTDCAYFTIYWAFFSSKLMLTSTTSEFWAIACHFHFTSPSFLWEVEFLGYLRLIKIAALQMHCLLLAVEACLHTGLLVYLAVGCTW